MQGAYNQSVCGPLGFLNAIETMLGVRQPATVRALRTAQYMKLLKQTSDGSQFYSQSFSVDAWTTASFLLSIRDELASSGWTGTPIEGLQKLNELAQVEKEQKIASGYGERLQLVRQRLLEINNGKEKSQLPLKSIALVDERSSLPSVWEQLIRLLENCGIEVRQLTLSPQANEESDLGKLQKMLRGKDLSAKLSLTGDGSLMIIDAIEESQAANFAAAWLFHCNPSDETVIVRGKDCSALSHACQSLSLPSLGPNSRAHFRAILQVLPLAFKLACRPLDPSTMNEFINLPGGPIPFWVGNKLLDALNEAPGIGGKVWNQAWERCLQEQLDWTSRDYPNLSQEEKLEIAKSKIEKFSQWFREMEASSSGKMSSEDAANICRRVEKWAMERAPGDENRVLYELATKQSNLLRQIIACCQEAWFPLSQLQKMIESVNSYGSTLSTAEAASWTIVDKPGQIWDAAPSILWWGFAEHNIEPLKTSVWSDDDLEILNEHGINLEGSIDKLRRETTSWRAPILNAQNRLVLVKPHMVAGRRASTHPVWDELKVRIDDDSIRKISVNPSKFAMSSDLDFAGVELPRKLVEKIGLPKPMRTWDISGVQIKGRAKESYSSIEKLLGCSLSWVLQYNAGLWSSRSFNIPQKQLLLGKLAHSVVDELFAKKKNWRPDEAQSFARECIADLIPKMAAGLLLPGSAPQLREAKDAIPASVFQLVSFLDEAGAVVEGTEVAVKAPFLEGSLTGIIDLLIKLPNGSPAVIDFKWSLSPYFYRKRIVEGRALQLAIYSWLVNESRSNVADFSKMADRRKRDGEVSSGPSTSLELGRAATPMPPSGFYMFRHGELFFTADGIFPSYTFVRRMQRDLPETFAQTLAAYVRAIEELNSGEAIASGVFDGSEKAFAPAALVEPPCNFCKLGHFCGVDELR